MRLITKLLIPCIVLSPAFVQAQDKLPSAKEVLANYIKVTGGKAAYEKIKSYKVSSKISVAAVGLNGTVEMVGTIKPMRQKQSVDLGPAVGKTTRCFAGKVGWESSQLAGDRVLKGDELALAKREASFSTELNPEQHYKAMKVVGKENVGNEECYKVELTPKQGKKETVFYSVKSGLSLKRVQTVKSPQGELKVESLQTNYKKVGGIMLPFRIEQKLPNGMAFLVELQKAEFNKQVAASEFAPPASIKGSLGGDR